MANSDTLTLDVPVRGAFRTRLSAAIVSLSIVLFAISPSIAAVATDQSDYAPGSVVTISGDNSNFPDGSGYLPGETVVVDVQGPNGYSATCEAPVASDGSWWCQVTLWDSALAVGDYTYTATGQASGVTESGAFTDATVVNTTLSLVLGATGIALGAFVNLSGVLANDPGDPDSAGNPLPADRTINVNKYANPGCGGAATLILSDTTGNSYSYDYTPASAGTYYIQATFAGSDNGLAGNARVTWQPSSSGCMTLTVDVAPFVSSTSPADNATGVAANANITITFNEAVTPAAGWFAISCSLSGSHTAVQSGSYILNPAVDFSAGETCTVTVYDALVADNDSADPPNLMVADYVFDFTIFNPNTPPSVSVTGVSNGSNYTKGSVPAAGCSVTDTEDGASTFAATLSAITGPYAADGIGSQTASCSYTDGGGLTANASATYSIVDASAPAISYVVTPSSPDGLSGWYVSNVTLAWTVSEPDSPGSLVKTGCDNQSIVTDQAATTYMCSATSAGGSSGPVSVTIKRDATDPVITDNGPTPGSPDGLNNWYVNPLTNNFSAADGGSGLDVACDLAFPK
ncbi:MAG TPA: Ig-like domain-containing protein, partial [Candidatus Limnocylindria bacterium]|nr:Ig-like domain-containing protein [Candidatus Limnocylindria bacterium]